MTGNEAAPHTHVDVELALGSPTYIVTALSFYGPDAEAWFESVGNLLYGRPGWACSISNTDAGTELLWTFGALGSGLFVISYEGNPSTYRVFDYDADDDVTFNTINELREWLDANEPRHADYVRTTLRDMVAADDWWLLKGHTFEVDVTYDGSAWVGTVRKLPVTFSSAPSLPETITAVREAIAHEFDAPQNVAPQIKVQVHLDEEAAAALTAE